MSSKAMSLKAKIRNYAKDNRIAAQVVLQNYMFERFLARLSQSAKSIWVMTCPLKRYSSTRFERMIYMAAIV